MAVVVSGVVGGMLVESAKFDNCALGSDAANVDGVAGGCCDSAAITFIAGVNAPEYMAAMGEKSGTEVRDAWGDGGI
jgi:hypothetical protein